MQLKVSQKVMRSVLIKQHQAVCTVSATLIWEWGQDCQILTPGRCHLVTANGTCMTAFLYIRNKLVTQTLGNIRFSGVLIILCNERGELNQDVQ